MTIYLCNVFTTAMLDSAKSHTFTFDPMTTNDVRTLLEQSEFVQSVGHPATCTGTLSAARN
jgi:hypothetical protein